MYKALDSWLPSYFSRQRWQRPEKGPTHLLIAVCDHFEPLHGADKPTALARMEQWKTQWPALVKNFKDVDGVHPRHTFFYPIEQYDAEIVESTAEVCRRSGGEVEIHLHHENDTPENLRATLEQGKRDFLRHGLLNKDAEGNIRYAFIHGNWALDNSHPKGLHCGVSNELTILKETGCYADLTMPSAPDLAQTRRINSLYYAREDGRPKSHDDGAPVRVRKSGEKVGGDLLLIQGPLGLNWGRRKFGILPRMENAYLNLLNPPRPDRLKVWIDLGIHVEGRPDCLFIKLHAHAGIPRNMQLFFGDTMKAFHQHLMDHYRNDEYRVHYVSAREMVNILHAIEDGQAGDPGQYRDYRYKTLLLR